MNKEKDYCHYSDLPSPNAYMDDSVDYDGMGNQGRFPKAKEKSDVGRRIVVAVLGLTFFFGVILLLNYLVS